MSKNGNITHILSFVCKSIASARASINVINKTYKVEEKMRKILTREKGVVVGRRKENNEHEDE